MVSVARARRRLPRRTRRAVDIAHRKRRDSHRGYPDLLQSHRIPIGGSLAVPASFPMTDRAVTFKFRVDRTSASATGDIVTLGNEGSIRFNNGALEVDVGGDVFSGAFIGVPRDSAEVVVAIQPTTGRVCGWVDTPIALSGNTTVFPFSWASTGTLDYDSIVGARVRSDLDVFIFQLPRHFREHAAPPAAIVDDLLFRAAIMTNLATSSVPFTDATC